VIAAAAAAAFMSFGARAQAGKAAPELDFWAVGANLDDVVMYRQIAAQFRAETGISVRVTPLGWGDFDTKYFAAMAAQIPPDLGITNLGGPMRYGAVGGLVDLRSEFPDGIDDLLDQFDPNILPQFTFRGRLFGLPAEAWTILVYYRKDILAELGVAPPRTWSELDRAIKVVEANGMRFFYGWTRGEQWSAYYHTLPFGLPGARRTADGNVALDWQEPAYQQGILHALQLWHLHENLGEGMWGSGLGRFLTDNRSRAVPLLVDASWLYQQIALLFPEASDKWDIVPWPRADGGNPVNVIGGSAYVLFEKSNRKRDAFAFLRYLNSLPVQRLIVLDRIGRAENPSLTLSPLKAMWGPENREFWQRPEFASSQRLVRTMAEVVGTFTTTEGLLGKPAVDRTELKIFDRMGGFIADELDTLARRFATTRVDLIQRFARGEHAAEGAALASAMRSRLAAEYKEHAPTALAALQRAEADYERRFGTVLAELEKHQDQADVLTYLEAAVAVVLLALLAVLLLTPRLRAHLGSYLFVAPPVLLAVVFVLIPAVTAFYLSFTEYHPVLPLSTAKPVGLSNYLAIFTSGELIASIGKTCLYVAITVPVGVALSLAIAALLNNNLRGSRYWRFIYFSPFVTSAVSVALVFVQLYQGSELGWINAALLELGLIDDPIRFLESERTFLYSVIGLAIWHGLAFNILIFLAALQQVPAQLYRAAEVDGAGWLRKFWHVSIPGIRPQLVFVSIMGIIGGFQVFEPIFMLGGGSGFAAAKFGPNDAGLTMVPHIYSAGFEQYRMGLASAIAYVLFVVIFMITIVQLKLGQETDRAARPRRRKRRRGPVDRPQPAAPETGVPAASGEH
jgi:ABC-type sugar transport system permease subunit/ABC-type glycerol-3-phosphate transport system substrate-binding protein